MPLSIDRSTESDVATLFDTDFIRSLTQYLGMDADTPSEDMPLSVKELLEEAISTCEQGQWRFILQKTVSIQLPVEALCYPDQMLFLPLGTATDIEMEYLDEDSVVQTFDDFTVYRGEPIRLWSENWNDVVSECLEAPYPITVSYTPGYTTIAKVPKSTIRALKVLVAHTFEYRGSDAKIPDAYTHNMMLGWLNHDRAIKYIVDDWSKVSAR